MKKRIVSIEKIKIGFCCIYLKKRMGFHKGNKFGGGRNDNRGGGRNFNKDNRSGGGGFGGRSDYHNSESYPATCNECGASFELPFRPKSERPVFCNNCFWNNKDEYKRKGGFGKNNVDHEKEYDQINRKLDKIMKLYECIADEKKGEK